MNIAIIDDLQCDRETIVQLLNKYISAHCADTPLFINQFDSGEQFLEKFTPYSSDIIFIDYYMTGISGFETAREIRRTDRTASLIFVTSSADFAIDCYKVKATGYLVKPYSFDEFTEILSLVELQALKERQFIEITDGYDRFKILIKEIIYCDISGHYVNFHTTQPMLRRDRMSFLELEKQLLPYRCFLPCFRGCLINMDYIVRMDEYNFTMMGGDSIPIRKREQAKLVKAYYDYLFIKNPM